MARQLGSSRDPLSRPDASAAQEAAIRRLRGSRVEVPGAAGAPVVGQYAGLVTRAVALGLDGALVNGVAALVGLMVGLALSILHLPSQWDAVVAAVTAAAWVIWSISYFTFFWSTTGQTPGARVMAIRVVDRHGHAPIKPTRAVVRFAGLILAAIPLCAGFVIMLWDDRRRCLQDRLARTRVVYTPKSSLQAPRVGPPQGTAGAR